MAQGGDSTLYGVRFDSIITHDNFLATPNSSGFLANRFELYYGGQKPKVVESFKHGDAYYELRENGWYKEIDTIPNEEFPDTCWRVMGNIRVLKPGCSETPRIESWVTTWISCDQHIGKSESYQREKTDTSEVKLLVWTGCSLSEVGATKYLLYNETQVAKNTGRLAVYITETIKVDVIARYVSEDKWIKPSHIIKEL